MCGSGGMCVHARVCVCMWVDKCAERGGEYQYTIIPVHETQYEGKLHNTILATTNWLIAC